MAQCAAGQAADSRADSHADRAAHSADQRARGRPGAGTRAGGQVVLAHAVTRLGVDRFAQTLAGLAAQPSAHRGAHGRADRATDGANGRAGQRAGAGASAAGQFMVLQAIAGLGVDHFAHAFTRLGAGHAADGRADDGAHRAAGQAHRGTGQRTRARAGAGSQVVFIQFVGGLGVDHFADATARHCAGDGANRRASGGAERPGDGAHGRAGQRAARGADAGGDFVLGRLAAGRGV